MADKTRLLDQVRDRIRLKHYSLRTEQAYTQWIRRFMLFHRKRRLKEIGAPEVEAFLSDLATERKVSASTQTQALSSLLFLYREVLGIELPWLENSSGRRSMDDCQWCCRWPKWRPSSGGWKAGMP